MCDWLIDHESDVGVLEGGWMQEEWCVSNIDVGRKGKW